MTTTHHRQSQRTNMNGYAPPPNDQAEQQAVFTPRIMTLAQAATLPPKDWDLRGILGKGEMTMIFGPSGSGKTLVMTDMLVSTALGETFAGAFPCTKELKSLYCYGEGADGVPSRFASALAQHGTDGTQNIFLLPIVPQLFERSERHAANFVAEIKAAQEAGIFPHFDTVVIDTQATATDGVNENNFEMNAVRAALQYICEKLNCNLIIIHHSGGDSERELGYKAVRNASQVVIRVEPGDHGGKMVCSKIKDGEQWATKVFRHVRHGDSIGLEWVDAPADEDAPVSKRSSDTTIPLTAGKILALLKRNAGTFYTVAEIQEKTGINKQSVHDALATLLYQKRIRKTLKDESKPNGNRNPFVYGVLAAKQPD